MSFKRSIFFVLVILGLLFGGLLLKNSYAGWSTDFDPPTFSFSAPGCTAVNANTVRCPVTGTITVTISCSDSVSGCSSAYYTSVSLGGAQPAPFPSASWTAITPPTSVNVNLAASGGSKTLWARGTDQAGNQSAGTPFNVIVGYTISGEIFNDTNLSGARDGGETLFTPSSTVSIYDAVTMNQVKTPITTTTGTFTWANLAPASYIVRLSIPTAYKATNVAPYSCSPIACAGSGATVSRTITITTADSTDTKFGLAPAYSISGTIYNDVDNSGTINAGDTPFATSQTVNLSNGQSAPSTAGTGVYSIPYVLNGTYTISMATPTGYKTVLVFPSSTVTVSGANVSNINFLVQGYFINGSVIIDYNHDGVQNGSDTGYNSNGTPILTLSGPASRTAPTNASGAYGFLDLAAGTYTVTLTVPAGYQIVGGPSNNNRSVAIGPDTAVNFYITPSYSIAGNIFIDTDKNMLKNGTEANYTGAATIQIRTGSCSGSLVTSVSAVNGAYTTGQTLLSGNYVACYTNKPASYVLTYPINGTPPFFPVSGSLTVGISPACNPGGSNSATCASGNLSNLNFGISDSNPWWQSKGSDFRDDQAKIVNPVPNPGDAACGGPYASIVGPGGTPGVIFSGSYTPEFSPGQASPLPYNWIAGGPGVRSESFSPVKTAMRTSYAYYKEYARKNGIVPTQLSTICTINNCTLPDGLGNGVYEATGNLTIINSPSYTFTGAGGKDYVILVNGDLTLNGNIWVNNGSTATFIVSGDIYVDTGVGVTYNTNCNPATHAGCNLEGFYSTDKSFIIQGYGQPGCSATADKRLNIAGVIVVNAARNGGTFQNNRDLCGNNTKCPAVRIEERPDLIINAPEFMKHSNFVWREVAP